MTLDQGTIQALTVVGLGGVAGVLWQTVKKVLELGVEVRLGFKEMDRRVSLVENKVNQ